MSTLEFAPTARQVFEKALVRDHSRLDSQLVLLPKSAPLADALAAFATNAVSSVPLLDARRRPVALLDVLDVLHVALHAADGNVAAALAAATAGDTANASGRCAFTPVEDSAPLLAALTVMAQTNTRRVPVVDADGELVSLLSQSDVLELVFKHIAKFAVRSSTLSALGLGAQGRVHAVPLHGDGGGGGGDAASAATTTTTLGDALRVVLAKHVHGVAVVNAAGALVGEASTTDVKRAAAATGDALATALRTPLDDVIARRVAARAVVDTEAAAAAGGGGGGGGGTSPTLVGDGAAIVGGALCVSANCTFADAIQFMTAYRAHRVWIVDDDRKPVGVLSQHDVIKGLAQS